MSTVKPHSWAPIISTFVRLMGSHIATHSALGLNDFTKVEEYNSCSLTFFNSVLRPCAFDMPIFMTILKSKSVLLYG